MKNDYNKSVMITGCSSGIGRAIAELLRQKGFHVLATARKGTDLEKMRADGFESISLDVDDPDSVRDAIAQVEMRTGGQLYGLVNNAGFGQAGAIEDLSRRTLEAQFSTNVFGAHQLTRHALRIMRRQGYGRIIQISSMLGYVAMPMIGAYVASKFALEGLSDTLRLELAGTNIRVVLIEPGPIGSRFRESVIRHFEDKIEAGHSAHQDAYRRTINYYRSGQAQSNLTLGPAAVAAVVHRALVSKNPGPRYRVTRPAHLTAVLKRLLPARWLDRLLLAMYRRR